MAKLFQTEINIFTWWKLMKRHYLAAWYLIRPQTAKSLDRAVPQFIKLNSQTLLNHLCARNILLWHMEQWSTQVTCNHPGGTSNLPCKAMAHSHKSIDTTLEVTPIAESSLGISTYPPMISRQNVLFLCRTKVPPLHRLWNSLPVVFSHR